MASLIKKILNARNVNGHDTSAKGGRPLGGTTWEGSSISPNSRGGLERFQAQPFTASFSGGGAPINAHAQRGQSADDWYAARDAAQGGSDLDKMAADQFSRGSGLRSILSAAMGGSGMPQIGRGGGVDPETGEPYGPQSTEPTYDPFAHPDGPGGSGNANLARSIGSALEDPLAGTHSWDDLAHRQAMTRFNESVAGRNMITQANEETLRNIPSIGHIDNPYGTASVNSGGVDPETGEAYGNSSKTQLGAMIEGLPDQEWFQRKANSDMAYGGPNQFAQPEEDSPYASGKRRGYMGGTNKRIDMANAEAARMSTQTHPLFERWMKAIHG